MDVICIGITRVTTQNGGSSAVLFTGCIGIDGVYVITNVYV